MLIPPNCLHFSISDSDKKCVTCRAYCGGNNYELPSVIKIEDKFFWFEANLGCSDGNFNYLSYLPLTTPTREQLYDYLHWEEHCIKEENKENERIKKKLEEELVSLKCKIGDHEIKRSKDYQVREKAITETRVKIYEMFEKKGLTPA